MALIPFNKNRSDIMNVGFGDFYNMLDDFFTEGFPVKRSLAADTFKIDLHDDDQNYYIEADLPGAEKDQIKVTIDEGKLQISVTREEKAEDQNKNYIHRERRYSSMQRSIYLADTDNDNIKAKLENGILTITVPKKSKLDSTVNIAIE